MAKVLLSCPNCGAQVELGEIECKKCGYNLKSGEAYESALKRAKGKEEHPEHYSVPIFLGVFVALGLVLFAGYMYQRRMETAIKDRPDLFLPALEQFQKVEDLVAAKQYEQARQIADALAAQLTKQAEAIKPPDPYAPDDTPSWARVKKYNKKAVKSLLLTLAAKAKRMSKEIPTA